MASKNSLNFTKTAINQLPAPKDKAFINYYDSHTKGLTLMVFPSGSKTFYYVKKIQGKVERIKIGRFPDLTVEQARNKAHEFNHIVASGGNPQDTRRAFNKEMTLKELHHWYVETYSKQHKVETSIKEDIRIFTSYIGDWGSRKLSNITEKDVYARHQHIGTENGKYAANRMLELVRGMYNKAIELGHWDGTAPVKGIRKFKEIARDRFLHAEELQRFFAALHEEENETARDYFFISLLTGQRKSNVLAMRWDEIALSRSEWRIPKTKNGDPLMVHLAPQVVAILERRKACYHSEWVFPGTGVTGHMVDAKKAWARILKRAEIKDLRIHDLRRTLGSWQTALGANSFIVGKTLGHKSVEATAIYARLNLDPVRESVNAAADAMFAAAEEE